MAGSGKGKVGEGMLGARGAVTGWAGCVLYQDIPSADRGISDDATWELEIVCADGDGGDEHDEDLCVDKSEAANIVCG